MNKLIYGNFKMNLNVKEVETYCEDFLKIIGDCKNEVAIFPSFVNLMFAKQKLTASKVLLGAQNVSSESSGAYTGEVSADMLKTAGVTHVIIGHSERRKLFNEKNEIINKKIKQCLSQGLKIVLCVGETKYERQNNKYQQALEKEISESLKGLYENELNNIIIAYEPIWAIGTGVVPTSRKIEEAIEIIRNQIKIEFSQTKAKNLKILYGGSVNSQNCKQFLNIKGVNGLLVGGASLKADEFAKICNT